jgi:hypothetical protein
MKIVVATTGIFGILVFLLILSITYHTAHTVLVEYDCRRLDPDVPDKIVKQCNYKNKGKNDSR